MNNYDKTIVDINNLYLSIAQWIFPKIPDSPNETLLILDTLTAVDIQVETLYSQALNDILSTSSQAQVISIIKSLKNIPLALEPYLRANSNYKEIRIALVRVYQRQAIQNNSETAVKYLFALCLDNSRDITLDASAAILDLTEKLQLSASDFLPIVNNTKISGVRNNCLKSLINIVENGNNINDTDIVNVCTALINDNSPETLRPLYKLIECWVQTNNHISDTLATVTFELTNRLVSRCGCNLLDAAIAQSTYITLKNIANLEYAHLNTQLGLSVRNLLRHTDVRTVNILFVIGLLDKIAKIDLDFLVHIVHEDLVTDNGVLPLYNLDAIVVAIFHNQGKYSKLLDEILADERLPLEVKSKIIREREE
ncbi:hypothetical protein [Nostoc sp.]|uniref:hypothetical protein n=1 Tax=Nostoc sp. TaxID=1180 RepID=UPI002FF4362B